MSKECKHEFHEINPFQRICCNCNAVAHVPSLIRPLKSLKSNDIKTYATDKRITNEQSEEPNIVE